MPPWGQDPGSRQDVYQARSAQASPPGQALRTLWEWGGRREAGLMPESTGAGGGGRGGKVRPPPPVQGLQQSI